MSKALCFATSVMTYLFFGKSGAEAYYVHDVTLNDANIEKMAPAKRIQLLAIAVSLLLLLCKFLVARR